MTLVCVAYVLGIQAAGLLDEWELSRNADQYRAKAVEQTAAVLRKMGTIEVGDTLSNFYFEDIDGELRQLKKIVTDRTLITYIQPDCDACLVELERLGSAADSPEDYQRVLIISSANPLHLQRLREDYGLGCLFLYDEERLFGTALKIQSFPFNLVINRDLVILEIHAAVLLPNDYERLFSLTSHPEPGLPRACRRVEGWLRQFRARRMPTCAASDLTGSPPIAAGSGASCRSVFGRSHPRAEKPDTRQMWTSAGHKLVIPAEAGIQGCA